MNHFFIIDLFFLSGNPLQGFDIEFDGIFINNQYWGLQGRVCSLGRCCFVHFPPYFFFLYSVNRDAPFVLDFIGFLFLHALLKWNENWLLSFTAPFYSPAILVFSRSGLHVQTYFWVVFFMISKGKKRSTLSSLSLAGSGHSAGVASNFRSALFGFSKKNYRRSGNPNLVENPVVFNYPPGPPPSPTRPPQPQLCRLTFWTAWV